MHLTRFEHKGQPVAARRIFFRRIANSLYIAGALVAFSLILGVTGYHYIVGRKWLDAFEEAAMILAGMGPLGASPTAGGKLFAGAYALYSGLVLVLTTGIMLAPILHRVLHHFHVEDKD